MEAAALGFLVFLLDLLIFDLSNFKLNSIEISVAFALALVLLRGSGLMQKTLGTKPSLAAGALSYSVYLWHQPVLSFLVIYTLEPLNIVDTVLAATLTIGLAALTYLGVEKRFMSKRLPDVSSTGLRFVIIGIFLLSGAGFLIFFSPSWFERVPKDEDKVAFLSFYDNSGPDLVYYHRENIAKHYRQDCSFVDSNSTPPIVRQALAVDCVSNTNGGDAIVLIGDSHAQMLRPGLEVATNKRQTILQVATNGCSLTDGSSVCRRSYDHAMEVIKSQRPRFVVVAQRPSFSAEFLIGLGRELELHGVEKLIVVGPVPKRPAGLPQIFAFKLWTDKPRYSWVGVDKSVIKQDGELRIALSEVENIEYISLVQSFCAVELGCLNYVGDDYHVGLVTWDYGHLTVRGSEYFGRMVLRPLMEQM